MRPRPYGLLSNRDRAQKIARCRELIGQAQFTHDQPVPAEDWKLHDELLTGESVEICPKCHVGHMVCVAKGCSKIFGRRFLLFCLLIYMKCRRFFVHHWQ